MANKRILYAAQALFVGPSPATGAQPSGSLIQLHRIQNVSYDLSKTFTEVQQFGVFAPIDNSVQLEPDQVSLNAGYLVTNVRNESGVGLYVGGDEGALKYILDDTQREKNYYIRLVPDGNSAAGYAGTDGGAIAIGNGVLASYQTQGQVGGLPSSQFTIQGLDILWTQTSSGFDSPAVNPADGQPVTGYTVILPVATTGLAGQATALRPGDITVDLNGAGLGLNNVCIQSYNLQTDLNLEPITCLGSKFPTSREPTFPVSATMSVDVNMRDLGTGRLSLLQCNNQRYDLSVTLRSPTCDGSQGAIKARYTLKGARLDSQSHNATIGPSASATLNFSAPIGGPQETGVGLFISGVIV